MKDEQKELLHKLEEALRMVEREIITARGVSEIFDTLKKSSVEVRNPESGLIHFAVKEYIDNLKSYNTLNNLTNAKYNVQSVLNSLCKPIRQETPISKQIEKHNGEPTEIKKIIEEHVPEPEPVPVVEKKKTRGTASRAKIKGTFIQDPVAQEIEEKRGTKLTYERYLAVLNTIALHPGKSDKKIANASGLSVNNTCGHVVYGVHHRDIVRENGKLRLRRQGIKMLKELKEKYQLPSVTESKTNRTNGEIKDPIIDKHSIYLHKTYGSQVSKSRYSKTKRILKNAANFVITVPELAQMTGWTKTSANVHLKYGQKRNDIVLVGKKDEEYLYALKENKKKAMNSQKPVKRAETPEV